MSKDIVQMDRNISESQLLDELISLALPERKPGGVTVREMMSRGLSEATARNILSKQEQAGLLYSVKCLEAGHPVKVWYRKTGY